MEDYNKIIESLGVHFRKAKNIKIIQPITIENYYDVENTLIRVNSGEIRYGKEKHSVKPGAYLFIPGGKNVSVTYGSGPTISLSNDDFISKREQYFESLNAFNIEDDGSESFSYISFEAKVFDSVNFYSSLDIPPFVISNSDKIDQLSATILTENGSNLPGKERIIKLTTDALVVEIFRYILINQLFLEQLATNVTYFKDPRLIDISVI